MSTDDEAQEAAERAITAMNLAHQLTPEQAMQLLSSVIPDWAARRPDAIYVLERQIEHARRNTGTYFARFIGGPHDGQTINLSPDEFPTGIVMPAADREITQEDIDAADLENRGIDVGVTYYRYVPRVGSEPIGPGASIDLMLDGIVPTPTT